MKWEVVKISGDKTGKNAPYASVGFGRVVLSSSACQLIDNFGKYKYAVFMKSRKNGALCIGLRFYEDYQENSLKIARRKYGEDIVTNSCSLDNKPLVEELFGVQGTNKKTVRYPVTVDDDDKNILVIYAQ